MSPRSHRSAGRRFSGVCSPAALAAFLVLSAPPGATAQQRLRTTPTCDECHGSLEFLRQHTATLDSARALLAPADTLAASAHGGMTCTDCHIGFDRYPHGGAAETHGCAYCHTKEEAAWSEGVHGSATGAQCTSCHGVHDVLSVDSMATPRGVRRMRAACASCHFEPRIPSDDPHADSVPCTGCHEPHRTLPPSDPASTVNVRNQVETCGKCHVKIAAEERQDVHYRAVLQLTSGHGGPLADSAAQPPSCSACHGAHGMLTPSSPQFAQRMVARCASCHEHAAETYDETYHGQASTLGSKVVATCADCHSAHDVYPASDPRSTVNPAHLVQTCRKCHARATASFTAYEPHADPHNRAKYPYVYWAFHLMSALLIGVFTFFGLHTLLWVARVAKDALSGTHGGA